MKEIPAGQFKTHCLAVMDQVQKSKEPVVVTKHGKPVIKVVPVSTKEDDLLGSMAGKATIVGDLIDSVPAEDWEGA